MAAIWTDVEITWQGETYVFRPTMDFINHLEQGPGRSLGHMLYRIDKGDLPSGVACEVIAKTINWANREDRESKTITPEDIYSETMGAGIETIMTVQQIIIACMPANKTGAKKD